jgi:hypothetical protein
MTIARSAALGVMFVLELCTLAALAYWGAQAGGSTVGDVVLAIAAPLAAAAVWGRYAAPRSARRLPRARRVALDTTLVLRWEPQERTDPGARGG